MSYQKIGVIDMDFYGWRIKEWRFNSSNIEEKHQEMKSWIKKWQRKYRIEQIYVNNAWAVQYRLLLKQQFQTERMVDFMKEDRLEKYLDELSEGTDFDFSISEIKNGEVKLYMQGDNPCNEDWCTEIIIKNPKTKKELIETLHEKMWELYDAFDVEEETYLMLEAKRNGFQGVPGVVDLVHNEEYKENALKEFIADVLRKFAEKPQNIDNFECYLEHCFAGWKEKFANTPEKMIEDMKHFAEMEV